jgi:drug/metabolite transporter (DMT)-like permease
VSLPSSSASPTAAGVPQTPAAVRVPAPWLVWLALGTVYLVWGSTYLGIRVVVETMPPMLGAAARFVTAGALLLAVLAARRGPAAVRPTREQLRSALVVGSLLMGANAVISVAETAVPSGLAALLVASVPLWVILLRRASGDRPAPATIAAVLVGFAGVALLLRPGEQSGDATVLGLLTVLAGAAMWASGAFTSTRIRLPGDPLVSTGWQMLLGGLACAVGGLARGELATVDPAAFSTRSIVALAYLVVFGSWVAFTAFAWLLQNAPISRVATYAFVNPVVAIVLGALVLDEVVTPVTLVGAAIIVVTVALVVRIENSRPPVAPRARRRARRSTPRP